MFGVNNPYADEMTNYPYLSKMSEDWRERYSFDQAWQKLLDQGDDSDLKFLNYLAYWEITLLEGVQNDLSRKFA